MTKMKSNLSVHNRSAWHPACWNTPLVEIRLWACVFSDKPLLPKTTHITCKMSFLTKYRPSVINSTCSMLTAGYRSTSCTYLRIFSLFSLKGKQKGTYHFVCTLHRSFESVIDACGGSTLFVSCKKKGRPTQSHETSLLALGCSPKSTPSFKMLFGN